MIDFTKCKRIAGRAYNGANGKKIAVEFQGETYMLKFPPSGKQKLTELSYTNSCVSEHLASSIFNMLGIKAQETILGIYKFDDKVKTVCACKDFTNNNLRLFDFCSIKNTIIDSETNGNGTELSEVLETIEKQEFVSPEMLKRHFWDMFVIDAFLGNFDRHNGNWGFLYDDEKSKASIAPIYDCGSCLLPQADSKTMRKILDCEEELNARIYVFPTSALKVNNQKIRYYDFLTKAENEDCNNAVLRIAPVIDIEKIEAFIDDVQLLDKLQKEFYKTYIKARYNLIIKPAYNIIIQNN